MAQKRIAEPKYHPREMFVTFEGTEGSGKSTALKAIADALERRGHTVVCTREPGAGTFGRSVRELLLHGEALSPWAELFLFLADRAEHADKVLRPALERGDVVLCDRYGDSTVAYQGHARGLPVENLRELNRLATGGLRPDLSLLFDIEPAIGLARLSAKDRLDGEPLSFHEAVRKGFHAEMSLDPGRWVVIDAAASPDQVVGQALWAIQAQLAKEMPA